MRAAPAQLAHAAAPACRWSGSPPRRGPRRLPRAAGRRSTRPRLRAAGRSTPPPAPSASSTCRWRSSSSSSTMSGSVRSAVSARCSDTQPSVPGSAPDPTQITSPDGGELVEHRRPVVDQPAAKHERLESRCRDRAAGQLLDHGEHAFDAAQPAADVLPRGKEPAERRQARPARPRVGPRRANGAEAGAGPRRRTTRCPGRPAGTRLRRGVPTRRAGAAHRARPPARCRSARRPGPS